MPRPVSTEKQYTCTNYQDSCQQHDSSEINAVSFLKEDTLLTGKQNKLMQAGIKQYMKFSQSCNFYSEHEIQPISKPVLTAIKPIYSSFPIPCRELEKSCAEANLLFTEKQAASFQILTMSFEHTEVHIR